MQFATDTHLTLELPPPLWPSTTVWYDKGMHYFVSKLKSTNQLQFTAGDTLYPKKSYIYLEVIPSYVVLYSVLWFCTNVIRRNCWLKTAVTPIKIMASPWTDKRDCWFTQRLPNQTGVEMIMRSLHTIWLCSDNAGTILAVHGMTSAGHCDQPVTHCALTVYANMSSIWWIWQHTQGSPCHLS